MYIITLGYLTIFNVCEMTRNGSFIELFLEMYFRIAKKM